MIFLLLIILIPAITYSRADTGADFLKFIAGARVTGLAGAFVGLADDASCLHYNPSSLSDIEKNELLFMKSEAILGCGYEYFAYIRKGMGFSILYFHAPRMDRLVADSEGKPTIIGSVEYYDLMVGFSYGKRINERLSLGGTIKGLHRKISPEGGYTGAIDFGALYSPFRNFNVGIAIQHLGPNIWGDELPRLVQIGGSYKIEGLIATFAISHHLLPHSDFEYRVGAEYWYLKSLCLRAGYYSLEGELSGATLGAGLRLKNFQFDFAQFPANIAKPLQGSLLIRF